MAVDSDGASAFVLHDWTAADVHASLLANSYRFYFSSMCYISVGMMSYCLYLLMFTYLTHLRAELDSSTCSRRTKLGLIWLRFCWWCFRL